MKSQKGYFCPLINFTLRTEYFNLMEEIGLFFVFHSIFSMISMWPSKNYGSYKISLSLKKNLQPDSRNVFIEMEYRPQKKRSNEVWECLKRSIYSTTKTMKHVCWLILTTICVSIALSKEPKYKIS